MALPATQSETLSLARPRAFEDGKALDAAIDCFWRRGFTATSVRDLASEMGINGPSLYNAFGDKHALFASALERYAECSMRERIVRLETTLAPMASLRAFFKELIDKSMSDRELRGCLIVNSAMEVSPHDAELRTVIASYLGELEDFFCRRIEQGQAVGEIDGTLVPRDVARLCLGILFGLRVAARSLPQRSLLEGMVRPLFTLLDPKAKAKPMRAPRDAI